MVRAFSFFLARFPCYQPGGAIGYCPLYSLSGPTHRGHARRSEDEAEARTWSHRLRQKNRPAKPEAQLTVAGHQLMLVAAHVRVEKAVAHTVHDEVRLHI